MSNSSDSTPKSPEEIRREMKIRFDAVNAEASDRHQRRRAASGLVSVDENKRWGVRPEANPKPANTETGDSGGAGDRA